MADYRLYCLDSAGRIGFADWLQAASDDDAIKQARKLHPDARKCEVWQKDRLVARLTEGGRMVRLPG